MSQHFPSQTIHEATFLTSGRVIDQVSVNTGDLDSNWIEYYEGLLLSGGGPLDKAIPQWLLVVQHASDSLGVASLGQGDRCLCSMLFLSGKDRAQESRVIYEILQYMTHATSHHKNLREPDSQLLALKQRPLLAVALFPGFDTMASSMALDTSLFLAAAWFDLHPT